MSARMIGDPVLAGVIVALVAVAAVIIVRRS